MTRPIDDDRFGVSPESLRAAREQRRAEHRIACYVPTRHEVATLSGDLLIPVLHAWMWDSPPEIQPTVSQIDEVERTLGMIRGICQNYRAARATH